MKKFLVVVLAFIIASPAFANFAGNYEKPNGLLEIKRDGDALRFTLESSVDAHVCRLEGIARIVDETRAAFTPDDPQDECVAVFGLTEEGIRVLTRSCFAYCGLNAHGSMDGDYKRVSPSPGT
jgi:hypothetical protein